MFSFLKFNSFYLLKLIFTIFSLLSSHCISKICAFSRNLHCYSLYHDISCYYHFSTRPRYQIWITRKYQSDGDINFSAVYHFIGTKSINSDDYGVTDHEKSPIWGVNEVLNNKWSLVFAIRIIKICLAILFHILTYIAMSSCPYCIAIPISSSWNNFSWHNLNVSSHYFWARETKSYRQGAMLVAYSFVPQLGELWMRIKLIQSGPTPAL